MEHWEFDNYLREAGYKSTTPRKIVYDVISAGENMHMNASDILRLSRELKNNIGTATVYRVLRLFEKIGLVYRTDLDDGFSRYEIRQKVDRHRHHHLICENCGNVTELKEDLLEKLEKEIERVKGFVVKDHKVKIYGICKKCREGTDD